MDEAELEAELEALGEEVELSGGWDAEAVSSGEMPSFLQSEGAVPEFIDEVPLGGQKVKEAV